ncbi:hypothetical protein C8F04DRAFT_1267331 [Mycena alexandri]|uniref:F-box domain-containing protein n=1 Tax=Mycena alexandri TaxID=1745969 RepID=A0AAD6WU18_9AGAR|nr:hypothetical protein C8F04DRAFT_1267331 [Mycena alexandri]
MVLTLASLYRLPSSLTLVALYPTLIFDFYEMDCSPALHLFTAPPSLPYDLWLKITTGLIHDHSSTPQQAARDRAAIASVNSDWKDRVYNSSSFWSCLTVFEGLSLECIAFFVAKCTAGPMHITISLCNIETLDYLPATPERLRTFVDAVFVLISPTSNRWHAFTVESESPVIFRRVSDNCRSLQVDSLTHLEISFVCMRSYSPFTTETRAHFGQALGPTWFAIAPPTLVYLATFCTRLSLDAYTFLPSLFRIAVHLRHLRLGAINPFVLPDDFALQSSSLESFDLEFHRGEFAGHVLAVLDTPRLTDLTVRGVYDYVHCLLARPDLLSRITRFCVYSEIGDSVSLHHLFTSLVSLEALDLGHGKSIAFQAYRDWACARVRFSQSWIFGRLRVLRLPRVELHLVLDIVFLVAESVVDSETEVGLQSLRLERPVDYAASGFELAWLRNMVPDFAITNMYSAHLSSFVPAGMASRLLDYPTAHSLRAHVPYSTSSRRV